MYINSPGGVVTSGMAIYDHHAIYPRTGGDIVHRSGRLHGVTLLAAGESGMRYALPNARIMVHQPSAGFRGKPRY